MGTNQLEHKRVWYVDRIPLPEFLAMLQRAKDTHDTATERDLFENFAADDFNAFRIRPRPGRAVQQ